MFNPAGMPMYPGAYSIGRSALNANFLTKINWSSLLSNTQKTLNVVNQAIPLYYQVKPVFTNLKSINKIAKEFTNNTSNNTSNSISNSNLTNSNNTNHNPTFFI